MIENYSFYGVALQRNFQLLLRELYLEASDTRVGEPKRASRPQDVHLSRKFRIIVKTFVAVSNCVIE